VRHVPAVEKPGRTRIIDDAKLELAGRIVDPTPAADDLLEDRRRSDRFHETMFRTAGASTPVVSKSTVVATTGSPESER
jgi:hypothetical protein